MKTSFIGLRQQIGITVFAVFVVLAGPVTAQMHMTVDPVHVKRWNAFADALYVLHQQQLEGRQLRTEERLGGYAGNPDFYREVRYFDADSGRLLSVIQWETARPDVIHNIEVNRYDADGHLSADYYAGFLPRFRNAPVQTLINLHHHDDGLQAFRQFDANGERIYEQCRGEYQGRSIMISLSDQEFPSYTGHMPAGVDEQLYVRCFDDLPITVDQHLEQLLSSADPQTSTTGSDEQGVDLEVRIQQLTKQIDAAPRQASGYVQRGDALFQQHDFNAAIEDYSTAIALDDGQDEAWFGRGMARGRAGQIREGIADLDVYIARHPDNSRAYTKRGVRYIWLGELDEAQRDLTRAVALDAGNAEAHDDLGVVLAQQHNYQQATSHFQAAIEHDPSYQKAHHNLALAYHLSDRNPAALEKINDALRLAPQSRNSLQLKAAILDALGRHDEARTLSENAEFLPEGNWSERFPVN